MDPTTPKRKISKAGFLLLTTFLFCSFLQGQGFREDMKEMYSRFAVAKTVIMEFEIRMTGEGIPQAPEKGTMKYNGECYLLSMNSLEYLQGKSHIIAMDPAEKSITVAPLDPSLKKENVLEMVDPMLEAYMKMYKSIEPITNAEGWKGYQLSTPGNLVEKADIFFDPETRMIRRVNYYYNPSMNSGLTKTEVVFSRCELDASIPEDDFSESKYVVRVNNSWKPAPAYSAFTVYAE